MEQSKGHLGTIVLGNAGLALGVYMAYRGKKGFWTYVGYGVAFSLAGSAIGMAIDYATDAAKNKKTQ